MAGIIFFILGLVFGAVALFVAPDSISKINLLSFSNSCFPIFLVGGAILFNMNNIAAIILEELKSEHKKLLFIHKNNQANDEK
jgi:O-antigen/teichoic acid export membrane protein